MKLCVFFFVLFFCVIKDAWFMHSASGPVEEISPTCRLPAAQDEFFNREPVFEETCCHATRLLQILRLDCRKQGRRLGRESKQCWRD